MIEITLQIIATVVCTALFVLATQKWLGAMQQGGYKNGAFWGWLSKKGNMFFNRLSVLAYSIALSVCVVALCFSFLGARVTQLISAVPFLVFTIAFLCSDRKFALKVPVNYTGRAIRLNIAYSVLTTAFFFGVIRLLGFLSDVNGSDLYGVIAYVPFAVAILCLPLIFTLANLVLSPFETARNGKFVKRAGQVLSQTQIIRVGVVGSYGKTSVKNIVKTLLEEKYSVICTPASFNTPMGIAKTVLSTDFAQKQVFIAEMGARRQGDIKQLCSLVKPDYAVFTGVCRQHVQTFGNEQNVLAEKSEIITSGAVTVCADSLKGKVEERENVRFVHADCIQNVELQATQTKFTFVLGEVKAEICVPLLGESAIENIALGVTLALEMGLTFEEIKNGLAKLQPVPHRLQLMQNGGVYILDDAYNANEKGAKVAIQALCAFDGRKCIVTPGIVECGILESQLNETLGEEIAKANLDKVILVGETLVGVVKNGYLQAGGAKENLTTVKTLALAQAQLKDWLTAGDAVLFLNDLPDVY
ncbi:MAG: UDP-N-acetylmuramoyl-tripeptide--D-alanyl-D-alanine ligase [Clostridia bacterium]|nr:UDP-N-acetylmuramoyl-tripeptide--D-alanyl-D-alanine ligase [Clostridia bacterium]